MYWSIVLKLIIGMIGVLIFLRFTGKTQMANLTPLDTVNSIVLGALIGSIIYMPNNSVWILIFAMAVWTLINILVRLLLKNNFLNRLIHGQADFLIKDGKINMKMLQKNNLGIEQFRAKLRESEIYSLLDVTDVRFETDGQFTIFKQRNGSESYLLISNGEIMKEELEETGETEEWLYEQMEQHGFSDIKDIYCAEYTPERGFYIITKQGDIINKNKKPKPKEIIIKE